MAAPARPLRPSRTQEERSAAMQRRLLDATVATLYDKGYSGTTTLEVQQRAGVSRGALLHHYGSRTELMIAAVDHLTRQRMSEVLSVAQQAAPSTDRIPWAIKLIWSTFDGPLFTASLELWMAARNDADLLSVLLPQERILGQSIRSMARELFGEELSAHPAFGATIELLTDAMRGAAARGVLRAAGTDQRLLDEWAAMVERGLS